MDLAQQVGGLGEAAAGAGVDRREVGAGQRQAAERDDGLGVEDAAQVGDRRIERLAGRAVELPDDVVAPVEAAEDVVQCIEAGADSLLG